MPSNHLHFNDDVVKRLTALPGRISVMCVAECVTWLVCALSAVSHFRLTVFSTNASPTFAALLGTMLRGLTCHSSSRTVCFAFAHYMLPLVFGVP